MSNLIERFVVEAPGSIEGYIELTPYICGCGSVLDGVGMALVSGPEEFGAGWVVAFKDLEKFYLLSKAAREGNVAMPTP